MTSWIEIDTSRLRANARALTELLRPRHLMAVVKANAYGHGLDIVAPALSGECDWFGVNSLEEAITLDVDEPILILGHTEASHASAIVRNGFRQALFRGDVAEALSNAAATTKRPAFVHLKIETGLHRLGIHLGELPQWIERLSRLDGIVIEGAYTHFSDVEDPESRFYERQLERFRRALEILRAGGITPTVTHAAPSAGILLHEQGELNLARAGIALYGIWPHATLRDHTEISLEPALSWKCHLAYVQSVRAGHEVGYDRTFKAPSERRVGVLPVGYFDGVARGLSNRGYVLVRGKRAPIIGRVAMNMTMVDVTDAGALQDDEVVLIGEQGSDSITAEEIAQWSDTIAYEVVSRLGAHIPRRAVS